MGQNLKVGRPNCYLKKVSQIAIILSDYTEIIPDKAGLSEEGGREEERDGWEGGAGNYEVGAYGMIGNPSEAGEPASNCIACIIGLSY